jgi:hypothetical protein
MLLSRKSSLAAPLVVSLVATLALPVRPILPGHGASGQPPALAFAVLPRRPRVRRRLRSAGIRVVALRIRDGRQRLLALRARGQTLYPRLPLRDSYPRGPP